MMKKIVSLFIVMALVLANATFIFAGESVPEDNSQNNQTGATIFDAVESTKNLSFELEPMEVGESAVETRVLLNSAGEEVGQITMTTKKIAEAIAPYSTGFQDYWYTDGTYRTEISVTGQFPLGAEATYNSLLNYKVRNGCTSLLLEDADITHDYMAPFPWIWDIGLSEPTEITVSSGSQVKAEAMFYYTYELPVGSQGMIAVFETGVKTLPSAPGYVRVWVDVNDGQ